MRPRFSKQPSASAMVRIHMIDLSSAGAGTRRAILAVLTVGFWLVLSRTGLTAAPLLAAMLAGVIVAGAGGETRIHPAVFIGAQGVIGAMIAKGVPPAILGEVVADWPVFLAGSLSVVAAGCLLGLILARSRVLPGSVALWGSFPGGATTMVLMAGEHGADPRLVAFMQYSRMIIVSATASFVAWLWVPAASGASAVVDLFPPIVPATLPPTLALCLGGAAIGVVSRIPAGAMLAPMFGGAVLQGLGLVTIDQPPWLLLAAFAVIGWSIGGRFTRPIIRHAARAAPRILASTFALIALCAAFAVPLGWAAGVDPLTAYLATSPGGVDSVAIIASGSAVDLPFVMALQTSRFLIILLFGPLVARLLARLAARFGA